MTNKIGHLISGKIYRSYEKSLLKEIKKERMPEHLALIMDGNRRFARELGFCQKDGYVEGRNKLEEVLNWCVEVGVRILTVYAFSTENMNRDSEEIRDLMRIFETSFYKAAEDERVHENQIRIKVLGQTTILPDNLQKAIAYAEEKTKDYDRHRLNLAIAYGGREEILEAMKAIAEKVKKGEIEVDQINHDLFSSHLYTAELPDPDLILRTSGEVRISNFLLWQLAYSELYFIDIYWPGLRKIDFLRTIRSYQQRTRRYGK